MSIEFWYHLQLLIGVVGYGGIFCHLAWEARSRFRRNTEWGFESGVGISCMAAIPAVITIWLAIAAYHQIVHSG